MISFLRRRWIFVACILILVIGFFIYQTQTPSLYIKADEKKHTVKRRTLKDTLTLSGTVNATEKVTLRFQSSGRLSWIGVKEGDVVTKGQGIASLDQRDVRNKMQQYLNAYVSERNDFDQSVDDNTRNQNEAVTANLRDEAKRLVQNAQYDLNNAVLNVQLQNLAIEYSYLSSPVDGIVTRVSTPVTGVNITPSQAEFEIVNPESIYFSALADQADVVNLTHDMQGHIVFDSFPDSTVTAGIQNIAYTPKEGETGTVYEVKLAFDQYQLPVKIGMSGDVDFTLQEYPNVLTIPTSYIKVDENNKKYVNVGESGKKTKRFVKTGATFESQTEIKSGLMEGDVIYD